MSSARSCLPVLLLFLLGHAGCGVTQVVDRAPDGRAVLVRSPQPDAEELRELHDEHGVRTVLNLRGEKPEKGWFQEEGEGVRAIGARWEHLPVSGSKPPTDEELTRFFDLVEDPAAWPILVHCQGGIHRTGAMVALYRMQYQGWAPERAVAEMEDAWFDWTVADREALKAWLLRYSPDPRRRLREPEEASAAPE